MTLISELKQVLEDWESNDNPMQKTELEDIISRHEAEEPLAVLADRKGVRLRHARNEKDVWVISLRSQFGIRGCRSVIHASTYQEAEQVARKYLLSLPDKGENK